VQTKANIEEFLIPGTPRDVVEVYAALAQRAASGPFALVEDDVIVLDTETTGLDPVKETLIEIAAVRLRGSEIVDEFQTFVDPGRHIPLEITELTGITDDDVAGSPDAGTAVEQLAEFVAGADIVAHNASFDRAFIMREALPGAITGAWLDSLALSHIALPRFKTHRLADLARAFGAHQSTHRAMDDVLALATVWRVLLAGIEALPPGLAGHIAGLSPETDWPLRVVFQRAAAAEQGVDFSLRRMRRERTAVELQANKFDAREVPLFFPEDEDIVAAFSAEGVAGAMYPDYEQRSEQVQMALEVAEAFRSEGFRVLEAGTGVGKSMAYLLPTALVAKDNAITCGVATKTNALMDQLVYHELPRLSEALGGLSYMALKGYEHYPCLRKMERVAYEWDDLSTDALETLATLFAYVAQTVWGDLDAVNLHWFGGQRGSLQASPNDCLKNKCPFYPRSCYLHGARRNANSADIVVTNHALLFRDVQMDNGILPPVRHWIIDEAHAVEAEARKQLSLSISARELEFLLIRLTSTRSGILARVRAKAPGLDGGDMLYGVTADIDNRADQVRSLATSFFSFVKDLDAANPDSGSTYDRATLWVGPELRASGAWAVLEAPGRSLAQKLDGLAKRLRDLSGMLEQFEGAFSTQEADLSNAMSSLDGMVRALTLVLDGEDESYVYSAELDRNPERTGEVLSAEKLDIGAELAASFYPGIMSAVFTSATLSTGSSKGPFSHYLRVTGLDRVTAPASAEPKAAQSAGSMDSALAAPVDDEFAALAAWVDQVGAGDEEPRNAAGERVRCRQLDSSYDFDANMTIYLPTDMPEPNSRVYRSALADLLLQVHQAMGGSVLTLFTNRREMEALYHQLKPELAASGLDLAAQTRGVSTKNLRDRFLDDHELSLFALRSFWEGFDAPGDTLRCVVIPKLPFGRPTDPIACERNLRESSSAWRRYSLPEAVMDLKQAAGRLIRTSTDSGYLVLADARLQTKGYGKTFLKAMPTSNIRKMDIADIAREIAEREQQR